ncbi:polyprenyl synthetase family protein [Janibacter limosus]|uniref:polyprenyl synthetase family protein n=1 Tax=Janibacter limosus TaxID=53458 RepID=UPI00082FF5F3|nr:polyprenyl synthetase family protein [Janibacter limosus]
MPHPLDLADLRSRVQDRIDTELDRWEVELAEIGPDVADLTGPVRTLLQGGKRLRAGFAYWGWRAAGREDHEGAVSLAASMELFQAAALIHDDVMDDSETRRGLPAMHRTLARAHSERLWHGDPDRFGVAGAILAGNLCLGWCDDLYADSGLPPESLAAARPAFERMRGQLMAGQFLDIITSMRPWHELDDAERIERSRHVIRYKSAKYSIEHPLLIGATAGGASDSDLAALSRYGLALGEAFQLRDDVLGVFGDPEVTGKPAGDDLREGKRTVLIARTLAGADDVATTKVDQWLGAPDLGAEEVEAFRELIVETGALDGVERDIADGAETARAALAEATGVADPARSVLADLVDVTTARST